MITKNKNISPKDTRYIPNHNQTHNYFSFNTLSNALLVSLLTPIQSFFSFLNSSTLKFAGPCLAASTSTTLGADLRVTAAPAGGGRMLAAGGSVLILRGLIREMRCTVAVEDMVSVGSSVVNPDGFTTWGLLTGMRAINDEAQNNAGRLGS
jgi:hypothetical protein